MQRRARTGAMASPQLHIVDGDDALQQQVCDLIVEVSKKAVAGHGQFSVGFSGGSAAKIVCKGLRPRSDVEWSKWHVFTCDERHVQLSSADSNIAYVQKELLDHVSVPASNVYAINPSVDVNEAAEDYVQKIRKLYPDESRVPAFDLLILGMGPDGHTCSLFPGHPGLEERTRLVIPITDSPKPPPQRITLTYPVLNNAKYRTLPFEHVHQSLSLSLSLTNTCTRMRTCTCTHTHTHTHMHAHACTHTHTHAHTRTHTHTHTHTYTFSAYHPSSSQHTSLSAPLPPPLQVCVGGCNRWQ